MPTEKVASAQSSLRIGDTVLFYFRSSISADINGYLYSELSSSPFNFLTVLPVKEKVKDPGFPNVNFAAFKVIAPNKYKATQHLNELYQRPSCKEYEIANAKRAVENENIENDVEQARRLGTNIVYGDRIQFQHIGSKKYVTVCSEASKTESNNLLVNVCEENSDGAIFKILPRYKVRSEGDSVHFDDQIKLESMKTQGQFLHVGSRNQGKAGYNVLGQCFEVNLSATESTFTLVYHYSPSNKHPISALRAGKCVRLFHKEDECYIVAEGSFASSTPVLEDVHCRLRRIDSKGHSMPSTSSNTYWQVEKVDASTSGDVVSWGETCRIKHMPTRMYLSVDSNLQVKLKQRTFESQSDFDTLFSFHPLIEEGDEVLLESYACIKHLLSGQWLHLEKKEYVRKSFDPEAEGLAGLQWDSAELYNITTQKDRGDYDSFTLQEVSEDLLDLFNYAAGIVPTLSSHIETIEEDGSVSESVTGKQATRIKKTLQEARQWLVTDDDRVTKNRQKLLRNLRIIEQLVEILRTGNYEDIKTSQKAICRECYNFIKRYLEGDSRKNENYLAKFIEKFQRHIRKELNAEEVLVEIVQDNINIVSRMAETRLNSMIDQFCSTRDPRFLIFLSSLCVCNERPIPSTQERILKELVLDKGKNIFLRMSIRDIEGTKVVFYQKPGEDKVISLRKLNNPQKERRRTFSQTKQLMDSQLTYELLEAQLHLFARLCKGNNMDSINVLCFDSEKNPTGYIDFDQALHVAKDDRIDITLRLKYAELILVMFVDVGENRSFLDHLCYSFIYSDIVATPYADTGGDEGETIALTGVENENFPDMKAWILTTLEAHASLRSDLDSVSENEFLGQIIDVLGYLVRYGYYDDIDDVDDCMKHLIRLLDGTTDVPSEGKQESRENVQIYKEKERKENLPENKSVFTVKQKALEVMELFFRFKFYVKLQKFVYDFKVLNGEARRSIKGKTNDTEASGENPPRILSQLISKLGEDDERLYQPHLTRAAITRLQYICGTQKGCGFAPKDTSIPELETVLIDLSTYDCDELVTSSLNLLTQMYFFQEELFGKAVQAQLLIAPQSIQDFKLVNEEILPELRQLLRIDANRKVQDRLTYLLEQLSELCVVSGDANGEIEPIEQNQVMLDNLGIVSEILSYVLSKGSDGQGPQKLSGSKKDTDDSVSVREEVFASCFRLLRYIATGQKNVQRRMFNRIDGLLGLEVSGDGLAHIADLLTEVFTGGPELMLKISEKHIEKIFEIIVDNKNAVVQGAFMITLQAMAKIEELDLPVGRNQAIIVKNFCRLRHTFCEDIIAEKDKMDEKRMEILTDEESDSSILQVLLSVTDLLATCAESKNLFIESVCQNIFTTEELLRIMTDTDVEPSRKMPFVRFFIQVYMKPGGNKHEIDHGKDMWSYLERVGVLLEKLVNFYQSVPIEERASIGQELVSRPSGRKSSTHSSKLISRTMSVHMAGITDGSGRIIPGLFAYIAEGIIPLLHTFYCFFFNPLEVGSSTQRDLEYKVSTMIATSLAKLSKGLLRFYSSSNKLTAYEETLTKLLEHDRIQHDSEIDKATIFMLVQQSSVESSAPTKKKAGTLLRSTTMDSGTNIVSPLPKSAFSDYKDQRRLNNGFNCYSQSYHIVYRGKNTASYQIKSPVQDLEYSVEGEELPLGPSFQHLLHLYLIPASRDSPLKLRPEVESLLRQLEVSHASSEQLSENEQIVQEILDRRCLQILRATILNQIKMIDPELKDRDPIRFREIFDQSVVVLQNQMQDFNNAIRRIIPLLSHPNELVSREALAFMKTLLFSGNQNVQGGLSGSLADTREETLFHNLKQRLETASLNYTETKDLETQLALRQETKKTPVSTERETKTETLKRDHAEAAKALSGRDGMGSLTRRDVAISMDELATNDDTPLVQRKKMSIYSASDVAIIPADADMEDDGEEDVLLVDILESDNTWTTLVLEVVGLMCDGQHRTLQNYLRDQPDNFKTINVVAEVANFLHTYTGYLASENLGQIHKILQSLIEMCVGNIDNQLVILDKLVIEPLNRILQLPAPERHTDCTPDKCPGCEYIVELVEVKGSAVELISVLLEEIDSQTARVAQGIGSSIDEEAVISTIEFFRTMRSNAIIRKREMDDDCERAMFRAYHVLLALIDFGNSSFKSIKDVKKYSKEAVNECINYTKTIEIHYQNEENSKPVLTRVNFQYNSAETLREDLTESVRWNINRDSMEDKQRALLDLLPALKRDINHQIKLKKTKILRPILAYHTLRVYVLMVLTLVLNLFVLFAYSVPDDVLDKDDFIGEADVPGWFPFIVYVFGSIHLILSIWIVVEFFLINWPHFQLPQFLYRQWYQLVHIVLRERTFRQLPQFTFLDVNIFGVSTLYMLVFLACSILSIAFTGYFYCVCLLFIIFTSDILQRVLRAVTLHGKSLIWVAILGLIVLFIYAVVSFAWLHNYFIPADDQFCETLAECFYSVVRIGLLETLGESIPLNSSGDTTEFTSSHLSGRLIYDLSFFVIITTIGLNIVFGIIVDSFGELREERSNVEAEQKSKCFVCDLPSYDFERKAKGFRNHIKLDHNMWDYVYYSVYVDRIDTGDQNAIQKYVYEKIADNDTGFFPQEEARCLAGEDDTTTEKLEELQDKVEGILQRFKDKDYEKNLRAKRTNQLRFEADLKARQSGPSRATTGSIEDPNY